MDHAQYVRAVVEELDALDAALADGRISARVPTCTGWTLADLAAHVGAFCGFWSHVLCEASGRPKTPFPTAPEGDGLAAWCANAGQHFVAELKATPEHTKVWTWYEPDQTAAFVARRSANELAIHRYDAQAARGVCSPIDLELAIDGIDELLERLVLVRARTGQATGQTLHLHGTSPEPGIHGADAEWFVTLLPDEVLVTHEHATADLALRGSASDLELLLYGRPTLEPVERIGDDTVLDLWYREFIF